MLDREKKLLILLGVVILGFGNVFLYDWYKAKEAALIEQVKTAQNQYNVAKANVSLTQNNPSMLREIEWLGEFEPKEGEHRAVQDQLMTDVQKEASRHGIKVLDNRYVERDLESEGLYGLARVHFKVNTKEPALYEWLSHFQRPEQSRGISQLSLSPERKEKYTVDCVVVFQQWFKLPEGKESTER